MNLRLQQFINAENITQSQLADTIGVARGSISHILSGRNKPGFDMIESLARNFPTLNIEWLITGKGKMYKNDLFGFEEPCVDNSTTDVPKPVIKTQSTDNKRDITRILVFFSDGTFQDLVNGQENRL